MAESSRDLGGISRFKGANFHIWKFQMRAVLLGRELMDVVDGSEVKPVDTAAPDIRVAWRKRDNQAVSLLCQAIDESMLKHVTSCLTSKQIWDKLKLFHEQNASENIHTLQQEFYKCSMTQGESVADFVGKLDVIVQQLASRGDTTFNEQAVISKILCNLPEGFDSLIPAWRMQPCASKTLDNLTLQLLQTESTLKARVDKVTATAAYVASASSKSSEYTAEQRTARRKEITDRKKSTKCWKCGIRGTGGVNAQPLKKTRGSIKNPRLKVKIARSMLVTRRSWQRLRRYLPKPTLGMLTVGVPSI